MSQDNAASIADGHRSAGRLLFWSVLAACVLAGAAAAWYYAQAGLTLSHYDARAHLVVARRVSDSLTPGWRQFGAVWLPLPHVLNWAAVQCDWCYRTGLVATGISVIALATGLACLARLIHRWTGSLASALAAPALVLANPNILYLQSTPMTEPLLFGVALVSLLLVDSWLESPSPSSARLASVSLAALVLTRYEGWLVAGALVVLAFGLARARGQQMESAIVLTPLLAAGAFFTYSWASTGRWVLSTDFYVLDETLLHQPRVVVDKMWTGLVELAGAVLPAVAVTGAIGLLLVRRLARRAILVLSLAAAAALPFLAFYAGHPFRVRYLVPSVVTCAALAALLVAVFPRRVRWVAALAVCGAVAWSSPPFDSRAPMLLEAQWETPFRLQRQRVTAELVRVHDGTPILASMGSLGHYMHEASEAGFHLEHFLHEGNGDLWMEALKSPKSSVRWILIEERAEGGDQLAVRANQDPAFLDGFERVLEAGGLVLYRRAGSR